jgi:hypothetical protein
MSETYPKALIFVSVKTYTNPMDRMRSATAGGEGLPARLETRHHAPAWKHDIGNATASGPFQGFLRVLLRIRG